MLQEVHVVAVPTILANPWVREHFVLTPADTSKWPVGAQYGNLTLVEKSIIVEKAHILQFGSSSMHRTGVIVDVRLEAPKPHEYDVILRLINTHLESMPIGDEVRPGQLRLLSKFLKVSWLFLGGFHALSDRD
jgi:tyrosyl-DNA phosphodiesterase 2